MRKLTDAEIATLHVLTKMGSYCPGDSLQTGPYQVMFHMALASLVKKKRATVEMTDDGPRYHAA